MYDLMIVGSGPAGISAALTAKARNINFIWFGSRSLSTKVEKAEKIMNYPGLIAVTGRQMQEIFLKQIDEAGIEITEKKVDSIYDMGGYYAAGANGDIYEAKTVLMTTGMASTKEIDGESRLLGCGVSYCATCDGGLYKDKEIAVVCTNAKYEEEVEYLADIASKVYLFTTYKDAGVDRPNVVKYFGMPKSVLGEIRVEAVEYKEEKIPVSGVFFLKDSINPGVLLSGLEIKDGHIVVNREQETNLSGCYAAGDCTGTPYQYTKAVGEGNVAVHSILKYIKENK